MKKIFLEQRNVKKSAAHSEAADIANHLLKRQHLGRAIILTDKPNPLLCVVRKQWMRLARSLQKDRSSTINAEKIMRLTHRITHMQRMNFSTRSQDEQPQTEVFFASPHEISRLPADCFTIYITSPISDSQMGVLLQQMPANSLVVDYTYSGLLSLKTLATKQVLEQQVAQEWQTLTTFLKSHAIAIESLVEPGPLQPQAIDDALDTLLVYSNAFLHIATDFHRALELAQPLESALSTKQQYDMAALLAYRVQALTPEKLDNFLIQTFSDNDTYFLRDSAAEELVQPADISLLSDLFLLANVAKVWEPTSYTSPANA